MAVTGKLLLAYGQDALTPRPDYVELPASDFAGFSSHRGRVYITDRTDAGTATAPFNDKSGALDPTNTSSAFYPMDPNSPAQLQLLNPVTNTFQPIYTGLTQDMPQTVRMSGAPFNQGVVDLADLFSILAEAEVPPGLDFDATAAGTHTANVSGDTTYALQTVQDRILAILADAGVAAAPATIGEAVPAGVLAWIYSGNVAVQPTVYSPGSFILAALQDAVDAEFPGVSNLYVDRNGLLNFKGRLARFDPASYGRSLPWQIGDAAACLELSPNCALIAADGFVIDRDISKVINNALFTPENVSNSDIGGPPVALGGGRYQAGALIYHPASIAQFGNKPITGQNLVVAGLLDTGDPTYTDATALAECNKFGIFYVQNFNQPQVNISQVKLRPVPLSHPCAETHWNLLCNVEIGDLVALTVATPRGDGFTGAQYFVEGISHALVPGGNIPDITVTLDLSPQVYYSTAPEGWAAS